MQKLREEFLRERWQSKRVNIDKTSSCDSLVYNVSGIIQFSCQEDFQMFSDNDNELDKKMSKDREDA
ncbi:hypothetical protein FACS189472_03170 [Alphaproteobacteria bacterium]|nr:hypothetical protein FACS189472_03170 [Alphaproteobacteria bacterium]